VIGSILVVSRWYPSFDRPGSGTFVADQVRALHDAGIDLTVVSFEPVVVGSRRDDLARLDALETAWVSVLGTEAALSKPGRWGAGVPVARLPVVQSWRSQTGADTDEIVMRHERPFLAFGRAFAATAARNGRPVEAIHAHTGIPDGMIALRLAEELGVGLVVSEHDSTLPERLADPGTRDAYRALVERAQVTVVSHAFAHRIQAALGAAGLGEHTLQVVPNPVPIATFASTPDSPRDDDELLFVGARRPHKGIDTLLRATAIAASRRPRLHLRLIGASRPEDEAIWIALAESLGIADRVRFEPEIDRAGVAAAMGRAGIFVHPSPWETFGMVAAESLVAGLPVAATPSGGVDEILGATGEAGEVAAESTPEALADAIERLRLRLPEIDRTTLPELVERRFSPSIIAARLLELHATEHERAEARARGQEDASVAASGTTGAVDAHDQAADDGSASSPVAADAFLVVARRPAAAERVDLAAACGPLPATVVGAAALVVKPTIPSGPPPLGQRIATSFRRRVLRQPAERPPDARIAAIRSAWEELAEATAVVVPVDIDDLELARTAFGDALAAHLAPGSLRWMADRQDAASEAMGR
jgi:glycosyltransferase involved in cell wall biosynthesis